MNDVIRQYCDKKGSDRIYVQRDFYNIYVAMERAEGRTPLPYYYYDLAMERYWYENWLFLIRLNHVVDMKHGLGSLQIVRGRRQYRPGHRLKWRKKEGRKIMNQDVYGFKEVRGDHNYGHRGIQTWVRETRNNPDLNGYELVME